MEGEVSVRLDFAFGLFLEVAVFGDLSFQSVLMRMLALLPYSVLDDEGVKFVLANIQSNLSLLSSSSLAPFEPGPQFVVAIVLAPLSMLQPPLLLLALLSLLPLLALMSTISVVIFVAMRKAQIMEN